MLAVLAVGVAAGCLALGAFLAVSTATGFLLCLLVTAVSLLLCFHLAAVFLLCFLVAALFLSLRLVVRLCVHRCSGAQESHDHHGTYNNFLHI